MKLPMAVLVTTPSSQRMMRTTAIVYSMVCVWLFQPGVGRRVFTRPPLSGRVDHFTLELEIAAERLVRHFYPGVK